MQVDFFYLWTDLAEILGPYASSTVDYCVNFCFQNSMFLSMKWHCLEKQYFYLFYKSLSSYSCYARIKTKSVLETLGPPLKEQMPFFHFSRIPEIMAKSI